MPKLKDIAEISGYSISTISKVLRNKGKISETTKEKILKIVEKINYKYNSNNIHKQNDASFICLSVPDIENPFYSTIAKIIEQLLERKGFIMVLCSTINSLTNQKTLMNQIKKGQIRGIIICPVAENDKIDKSLSIPIVLLDKKVNDQKFSYVMTDNFNAAKQAVLYLIHKGKKKIVCIKNKHEELRLEGYLKALEIKNLPINNDLIIDGDFTFHGGYSAMNELLSRKIPFDAVFADNDIAAFGVIERLRLEGISVPGDVSVLGFDNIWLTEIYTPNLSTVSQPINKMCEVAAEILFKKFEDPNYKSQILIPSKLIIRNSA